MEPCCRRCELNRAPPVSQVNFYNDHTKVIISKPDRSCLVTYINRERNSYTYKLCSIQELGCSPELQRCLRYILKLLQEWADA